MWGIPRSSMETCSKAGSCMTRGELHISLGFGYEVVPSIFVGASANYATGSYLSDREYIEVDTADFAKVDYQKILDQVKKSL